MARYLPRHHELLISIQLNIERPGVPTTYTSTQNYFLEKKQTTNRLLHANRKAFECLKPVQTQPRSVKFLQRCCCYNLKHKYFRHRHWQVQLVHLYENLLRKQYVFHQV